jgi:aspartate ammonia-lyase
MVAAGPDPAVLGPRKRDRDVVESWRIGSSVAPSSTLECGCPDPPRPTDIEEDVPVTEPSTRREHDLLGERDVPADAYYGIQTLRALENFRISDVAISHFPRLIHALAHVKRAAARANWTLGVLDPARAKAIEQACTEIADGELLDQFVVDMIQGGAGTSTNMNANEVIANRALEILGHEKGDYDHLHPNNHVNLGQSTNDVYPTAVRLGILLSFPGLAESMDNLIGALREKGDEFADILKMGRTQLQDAVPMTLGQEFHAWATTISEDIERLTRTAQLFQEINLGATAIGTGITADVRYSHLAVEELSTITGIRFTSAVDLVEATSDTGAFVTFSGILKRIAVKISKICNDLRLLSSGPRAGLGEISLPAVQPGSSIMPGKVNPVIPEVVNQVAYEVVGNDLTVTFAAEAGQLQLNAFEPVICFNILESMRALSRAMNTLAERCIRGIEANRDVLTQDIEQSIGVVTALVPVIGYQASTEIAKEALRSGRGVAELVLERGLLDESHLRKLLSPAVMTRPGRPTATGSMPMLTEESYAPSGPPEDPGISG